MENWKEIEGHIGSYLISDQGRVKSLDRIIEYSDGRVQRSKGRVLKPHIDNRGYRICALSKNGKGKTQQVHRLVAQAFIPNPENKPQVNHKNGIKTDNQVNNLEWVTNRENSLHAVKTGLIATGKDSPSSKLTGKHNGASKKVINTENNEVFESAVAAAKSVGMKADTLQSYLRGARPNKTNFEYV